MRIAFDVLGSTERSGGMRLHSTEMIKAWTRLWPDDNVTIVGPDWVEGTFGAVADVRVWRNESAAWRSFGQLIKSWWVARDVDADALVSLSPIVSPLCRRTTVCFQHDWRHRLNPHEFPVIQRVYRRLWELSARHASFNACISRKAMEETAKFVPGSKNVLIENGWDHARDWRLVEPTGSGAHLVAFGHHNNKRPELSIKAFARAMSDLGSEMRLVILGARGEYARELKQVAVRHGIEDSVDLPGFVSDEDYQRIVSTAAAVLMPSTDEGFGLPVAEALYLGIPAIVTTDSGMPEVFGDAVVSVMPDSEEIAVAIRRAIERGVGQSPSERSMTTWDAAVRKLRTEILRVGDL